MKLKIKEALQQGIAAHKDGKHQEAERLYRAIIQSQPTHPDANHNLGILAVSVNKADAALPLFKTALEANPKIEQFWISYIEALIKEKQFDNAKQVLEKAKTQGLDTNRLNSLEAQIPSKTQNTNNVRSSPPKELLDRLLEYYKNGRFNDAEKLAISITNNFPKHHLGWKVLGALLKKNGRVIESLTSIQKSVQLKPQDVEAHYNLGNTLKALGRLDEAVACFTQAITLKPDFAEVHYNLGNTLKALDRLDEAIASFKQAITLKPDFAEAHNNLGSTLQEHGRLDEAVASYTQAITLKSDFVEVYNNLGNTLQELGRLDEAVASYTQAITLKPDFAEAHESLASMKKFDSQDEQYSKMLELYIDENISEEQRCHINFGLAKACEDLGNYEQAFTHYSKGNELRKKFLKYDINQDVELFRQIKSNYPRIECNSLEAHKLSKNLIPIFIVGMPRSGTTLVEQIISSHSKVTGAGELTYVAKFGAVIAKGLTEINYEALLDFRHKYLEKLENISKKNLIVTDKMPQNFRYIGLLAAAFPEAKIIHMKRNPAAICWANYKKYFKSKGIGYSYAIDDIITYYKLYKNLMGFWTKKLNNRIYNLDYELLTVNQESETRKLIEYLDLDWDKKCLSPENNIRSVATASNIQVRQKLYKGSSEQWKKYQPFLNGAFDNFLL